MSRISKNNIESNYKVVSINPIFIKNNSGLNSTEVIIINNKKKAKRRYCILWFYLIFALLIIGATIYLGIKKNKVVNERALNITNNLLG